MINYFKQCLTVAEIKTEYRKLAKIHHPDLGGDPAIFRIVNDQYLSALKNCSGETSRDDQGREHIYKFDEETEKIIMKKASEFLSANLPEVDAYIIGYWIWITGNTKAVKDEIKAMGFKWSQNRSSWYWQPFENKKHFRSKNSLNSLASKYGAEKLYTETREQLAA